MPIVLQAPYYIRSKQCQLFVDRPNNQSIAMQPVQAEHLPGGMQPVNQRNCVQLIQPEQLI